MSKDRHIVGKWKSVEGTHSLNTLSLRQQRCRPFVLHQHEVSTVLGWKAVGQFSTPKQVSRSSDIRKFQSKTCQIFGHAVCVVVAFFIQPRCSRQSQNSKTRACRQGSSPSRPSRHASRPACRKTGQEADNKRTSVIEHCTQCAHAGQCEDQRNSECQDRPSQFN